MSTDVQFLKVVTIYNAVFLTLIVILLLSVVLMVSGLKRRMHQFAEGLTVLAAQNLRSAYTCIKCHEELPDGAHFCHNCGSGTELAKTVKICNSCNMQMQQNARYCPNCRRRMWFAGSSRPLVSGPLEHASHT